MKHFNQILAALILLTGFCHTAFSETESEKIWVTFENSQDVPKMINEQLISTNENVQVLINNFNIIGVEQALSSSRQDFLLKVYEVECSCDAEALMSAINSSSDELKRPEPAPKYELLYEPDDYGIAFVNDYPLDLIEAQGAWDLTHGDPNVILGISDGNFYMNHEDLSTEIVSTDTWVTPANYYYHGTAVAQIAAGSTDNEAGKSSIGFDCKLTVTRMNYNYVIDASYNGARVVNLSWTSGCSDNWYVQQLIDEIYNNGTIIVAAAGNGATCGGSENLVYPAAHEHVIAVSSVGPQDNHERFVGYPQTTHQHNSSVDICAPGYDVPLTAAPGWYLPANGSSFAAPYVTGTLGLMLSVNPCLTFEEAEAILKASADDIYGVNPQYIGQLGAGRLNAQAAVQLASEYSCGAQNGGLGNHGGTVLTDLRDPSMNNNQVARTTTTEELDAITIEAQMYPNPTSDFTTIMWNTSAEMTLQIVTLNGAIVESKEITENMNRSRIDIETRGIYFIQLIKEGNVIWSEKLVRT